MLFIDGGHGKVALMSMHTLARRLHHLVSESLETDELSNMEKALLAKKIRKKAHHRKSSNFEHTLNHEKAPEIAADIVCNVASPVLNPMKLRHSGRP
jgi:hypothetical protein